MSKIIPRTALIASILLALGGCQKKADYATAPLPQGAGPIDLPPLSVKVAPTFNNGVTKFCDAGRAIYVSNEYAATAIAVVERAHECPQPQEQVQ